MIVEYQSAVIMACTRSPGSILLPAKLRPTPAVLLLIGLNVAGNGFDPVVSVQALKVIFTTYWCLSVGGPLGGSLHRRKRSRMPLVVRVQPDHCRTGRDVEGDHTLWDR